MTINLGTINVVKNIAKPSGVVVGVSQPTNFVLAKSRYQRVYNWDVLLPDVSSLFGQSKGILGSIGKILEGVQGLSIGQYCQNVEFGDYSINDLISMRYGPYSANYPGLFTIDKVRMSFLKPVPDIVSMYFNAWKNLIVDKNGLYNVKSKYAKTIYIRFLDSTGISIHRYKLLGAFPIIFPKYNLDYNQNDVVKIQIEFSVDKIDME